MSQNKNKKLAKVLSVLAGVAVFVFMSVPVFAQDTPRFSAQPKTPLNPTYPAAFYYTTNDNVTIFDTIELLNFCQTRDITVQLVGKMENQEGWFAFASNPVVIPAFTVFVPEEVSFMVTLPDGICEDVYLGRVEVVMTDYDGAPSGSPVGVRSLIGVESYFNVVSGLPCVGGEVLPGLGSSPSYTPLPAFIAAIVASTPGPVVIPPTPPVLGDGGTAGGGAGSQVDPPVLLTPGETPGAIEETPIEVPEDILEDLLEDLIEPILTTLKVLAHPQKRVPATGNWGTRGLLKLYKNGTNPDYTINVNTANSGEGTVEDEFLPGSYVASFKGLSHLSKNLGGIVLSEGQIADLDFTFGNTFGLLAGDVHIGKDDFINSLDLSATVIPLYGSDEHADLNKDGIVNGLDLSIEVINLYSTGEIIEAIR